MVPAQRHQLLHLANLKNHCPNTNSSSPNLLPSSRIEASTIFPLISASMSIDYSSQHVSIPPSHVDISWVIRAVSKIYFLCVCMSSEGPRNLPQHQNSLSQPHHALSSIIESPPPRTRRGRVEWLDFAPCSEDCHEKAEEIEGGRSRLGRTLWFGSSQ